MTGPGTLATRRGRRLVGLPALILFLLALGSLWGASPRSPDPPPEGQPEKAALDTLVLADPAPLEEPTHFEGQIGRGEAFFDALRREGLETGRAGELVRALRKGIPRLAFDPRVVQAGDRYIFDTDPEGRVEAFEFFRSSVPDTRFLARRLNGGLRAWKEKVPLERKLRVISGRIQSTLWDALRQQGADPEALSDRLADIFEYKIDFMVDCRPGDRFALACEVFSKDGIPVRYGNILAASYRSGAETHQAFLHEDANGDLSWHDAEGRSLEGLFLKSPLNFRRISSGYANRRFHPVLKRYLPHHGIDYAADFGTPVWATAGGTVTHVGKKGPLGNYVEIRHKSGHKTGYGHLSRYRKDLRAGATVKRKDLIGYVGATGRATGPHLHYNFYARQKGRYVLANPASFIRPRGKPVPASRLREFRRRRDQLLSLLDQETGTEVATLNRAHRPPGDRAE